LITIYL